MSSMLIIGGSDAGISAALRIKEFDEQATIYYVLPGLEGISDDEDKTVLPIATSGGPKCTIDRTFSLSFSLAKRQTTLPGL